MISKWFPAALTVISCCQRRPPGRRLIVWDDANYQNIMSHLRAYIHMVYSTDVSTLCSLHTCLHYTSPPTLISALDPNIFSPDSSISTNHFLNPVFTHSRASYEPAVINIPPLRAAAFGGDSKKSSSRSHTWNTVATITAQRN